MEKMGSKSQFIGEPKLRTEDTWGKVYMKLACDLPYFMEQKNGLSRMLRYKAGDTRQERVRWQDRKSSSEVAEMCWVEDLSVKLRQRRLRWFGHVKRIERVYWVRYKTMFL